MRIAICGSVEQNWVDMIEVSGHRVTCFFTDTTNHLSDSILRLLNTQKCPIQFGRIGEDGIALAKSLNTEVLFCIGYPYRIPIDPVLPGINVHPTLLPNGRGPQPIGRLIAEFRQDAGVTLHKLTPELDKGDIVLQEKMTLTDYDTRDTYLARFYRLSSKLTMSLLSEFDELMASAVPQHDEAITWSADKNDVVMLDPKSTVDRNLLLWRAYGSGLTAVMIGGRAKYPREVIGWIETETGDAGTTSSLGPTHTVLAVLDGYLLLAVD